VGKRRGKVGTREQGRGGGSREGGSEGQGEGVRRETEGGSGTRFWTHLMSSDVRAGGGVATSSAASCAAPPGPSLRPKSTVRVLTAAAAALIRYTPPSLSTCVREEGREGGGDGRRKGGKEKEFGGREGGR
jgi:hypothetical protein